MSNESEKLYAERDAMELDSIGGYYFKHVLAMTAESLHSKGDIAAELGWRDSQIDILKSQLTALTSQLESVVAENAALKQSELEYDATCREEFGSDWVTELTETPATSAFLAEVRASGVEMLLSSLPPYYTARADIEKFAAQLRLGGAE